MPEAYIFERFASIYNIIGFSNMEGLMGNLQLPCAICPSVMPCLIKKERQF